MRGKRRTRIAANTPEVKIEIEWQYAPPGYFEEKIIWERKNCLIEIEAGHITARMSADLFDSEPGLRDSLTKELNYYFLGAQLIRRQAFDIHGGAINRVWPDGRRDTTLVVHAAYQMMITDHADIISTNDKGVVHDTRRDRIEAAKNLAELSACYCETDPTARKILDSFDDAVRDPGNELVYLYEVWEALGQKFGSQGKAKAALHIDQWRRLRHLACNLPLNQGRHRGLFAARLRDATAEELDEARTIARDMAIKYLRHLDEQQKSK